VWNCGIIYVLARRSTHIVWANTLIMVHATPPKHVLVHQTPYTCLPTASWWSATLHEDGYSHTHLYKGDLTSPPRHDLLFQHLLHIPFHFLHRLERWSANMPTYTLCPTAKTHHHHTWVHSTTVASTSSSPDISISLKSRTLKIRKGFSNVNSENLTWKKNLIFFFLKKLN